MLQATAPEGRARPPPAAAGRGRVEEGFLRGGALTVRVDGGSAELLELPAPLLPVDRHQREDEVGLVELHALGVDPDEDVGDLLLVRAVVLELDHLEAEVPQVVTRSIRLEMVLPRRSLSFTPGLLSRRRNPP